MIVRPAAEADRAWAAELLSARWGGTEIVVGGRFIDALAIEAFVAESDDRLCGLLTYDPRGDEWEIVTLDAVRPAQGVGTALLAAMVTLAASHAARRLIVVTTNDNLDALHFYQRRGFRLAAVAIGAARDARRLKPTVPRLGSYGIDIRDELRLERDL